LKSTGKTPIKGVSTGSSGKGGLRTIEKKRSINRGGRPKERGKGKSQLVGEGKSRKLMKLCTGGEPSWRGGEGKGEGLTGVKGFILRKGGRPRRIKRKLVRLTVWR